MSSEPRAGYAGRRDAALARHRAGELEQARAAYEVLNAEAPDDVGVVGLLGVVALQQGRTGEAEPLLRRAVAAGPGAGVPTFLRNLNNLVVLLRDLGREDEARALLAGGVPGWPEALAPDGGERATLMSLVEAMLLYGQSGEALALLESVLPHLGEDAKAQTLAGRLRLIANQDAAALAALERAATLAPKSWEVRAALGVVYGRLGRVDEARAAAAAFARASRLCAPRQSGGQGPDGQGPRILTLNAVPTRIEQADFTEASLHFQTNYISQVAVLRSADYQVFSLFADLPDPLPELPPADLVFNNMASAERMSVPGVLAEAEAVVAAIGLPVINPPRAIAALTRQKVAERMRGIPGLRVPAIERYRRDPALLDEVVSDIGQSFAYPLIIRHVAADQSARSLLIDEKTALLVHDAAALKGFLQQVSWPEFYAIEYVPLAKADGNFRKLRAVFFADDVFISRGDYYSEWLVGGWRVHPLGVAFNDAHPHLVDGMNRLLRDPDRYLGPQVRLVLEAVRDRVPADIAGMDFDVDDDGRVVMFEVGTTMNLLQRPSTPARHRMPEELDRRVNAGFDRLVARKIAGTA